MEKWCLQHDKIPDNPDEMFVKRSFSVIPKSHKVVSIIIRYTCTKVNCILR
jgi:hypothetical protein